MAQEIDWVEYVLKKRDSCHCQKVANQILKKSLKFVIENSMTLEEALTLVAKNDNVLWADSIPKELENINMAFEIL